MKNNLIILVLILINNFIFVSNAKPNDSFFIESTIVEIKENGNLILGKERGIASTIDGLSIEADNLEYDKNLNIIRAYGEVIIIDPIKDFIIKASQIEYLKNEEKIITLGKTEAIFESNYNFTSSNNIFLRDEMSLESNNKTTITDKRNAIYELESFKYFVNEKILKGKNIYINENNKTSSDNSDKFFFADGFFNLLTRNYYASDTEVFLKKNIFDNTDNDPRIFGASSSKTNDVTIVNKAVFTSCKINNNCTPWSIKAKKITHDQSKKQLMYDNAILKIYDVPILYFPKFFHPDPTVKRQSGFLQPRLNNSQTLGSSLTTPYFHVISDNKDLTMKPTLFDSNIKMFQTEYRQENENSSFISDFNLTTDYKSSTSKKKNSITHFFSKYKKNLNLENYITSELDLKVEMVSNDTYLKIFDSLFIDMPLKPSNNNVLRSDATLYLNNQDYDFTFGLSAFENLQKSKNDRYEFILPQYSYNSKISNDLLNTFGSINFSSLGRNVLIETNNLETSIVNNINFFSFDKIISNLGIKTNHEYYLKNINVVGKQNPSYKSSLTSKIDNLYIFNSSLPLKKFSQITEQAIIPKMSIRFNPGNMINYSSNSANINTGNIFSYNRLGVNDTFEAGKSITIGVNYINKNLLEENKNFEFSLASILRKKDENNLPVTSSFNQKNSNLFGSMNLNYNENYNFNYNFSLDQKLEKFEYNSIGGKIKINNFVTGFNFIEENGSVGNTNSIENNFTYNFDKNNFVSFKTRRNRTLNLTEYYDLVYEYNTDCLTAGIKYNKTYYQDRDAKPTENLFFTVTLYPLTTYEKKFDR